MDRLSVLVCVLATVVVLLGVLSFYQKADRSRIAAEASELRTRVANTSDRIDSLEYDVAMRNDQLSLLKKRVETEVDMRLKYYEGKYERLSLGCGESDWDNQSRLGSVIFYEWERFVRVATDYCLDELTLVEYDCDGPVFPAESLVQCPNGCHHGACV